MSFDISFDYRFDSLGYFDDPARRAALEEAARIWEASIKDEFPNVPVGTIFTIDDPNDSSVERQIVVEEEIDDVLIFIGATDLNGSLGVGGFDGVDAEGDAFKSRVSGNFRGEIVTDFEPWTGTVTFDSNTDWNFDLAGAVPGQIDFLTVALHEIGHVLGFGTSAIFKDIGAGGFFTGPNAVAANDGDPVPLQNTLGHVVEGFDGDTVLLDPFVSSGARILPGTFDLALLADIGYEIDGFEKQGERPAITTDGDDITVFGTILGDAFDGKGGRDQIQGNSGNDTILGGSENDTLFGGEDNDDLTGGSGDDQLQGGNGDDTLRDGEGDDRLFGQAGVDTFVITGGGGTVTLSDFDFATEVIVLEGSGFADEVAAVAAVTKPFSNVSQITFADGTEVRVFQESGSGTALTAANLSINDGAPIISDDAGTGLVVGGAQAEVLRGLDGDDTLDGGAGNDTIDGGDGVDTWRASGTLGVDVDLGAATARDGSGDTDTLVSVEWAEGAAGDDSLSGSLDANRLSGAGGSDTLTTFGGGDTLDGGSGSDSLTALDGANLLVGGSGNDTLRSGEGTDTLDGGTGADLMDGGGGDDSYRIDNRGDRVLEGDGGGRDTILATAEVTLDGSEVETVILEGSRNLRVNGNAAATEIVGNGGSNILIGGGAEDTLTGGGGRDYFAFQVTDADGAARITDFGGRDQLAIDDRFFGLGDGRVDVRAVTDQQAANALSSGAFRYDARSGELLIDIDGRRGPEDAVLITIIEGGGPLTAEDVILF
ncbi:hemolysin [Jannaschia pagri]|uniref:Hemolysin n=1 Tax=Jannaschia pagri TaxID=2829797 RepID=A0ABQ4NM10_9RHOB|nr:MULTISPECIES: matrixin family metalloprotease [unclassified Jannaschia]GIT91415.1 hemolysin [Jannaschia sp. AI_61]GIT95249.1 hemolysin [Jannaschia sp. AI_62]